jgi:hypothetical protein
VQLLIDFANATSVTYFAVLSILPMLAAISAMLATSLQSLALAMLANCTAPAIFTLSPLTSMLKNR